LKRLKKAYFPCSTLFLSPSRSLGTGITLASKLIIFFDRSIPRLLSSYSSWLFFSLLISESMPLNFSGGFSMVASETFFLRISSKSSGIPVKEQSYGKR
jgi:hypothetical protein